MIIPALQMRKWEPEEVRDLPKATTLLSREQGLDLESRVFRRHGQGMSSVAGVKGRGRSRQRIGSEIRIQEVRSRRGQAARPRDAGTKGRVSGGGRGAEESAVRSRQSGSDPGMAEGQGLGPGG